MDINIKAFTWGANFTSSIIYVIVLAIGTVYTLLGHTIIELTAYVSVGISFKLLCLINILISIRISDPVIVREIWISVWLFRANEGLTIVIWTGDTCFWRDLEIGSHWWAGTTYTRDCIWSLGWTNLCRIRYFLLFYFRLIIS